VYVENQNSYIANTDKLLDYKSNTFLIVPHILRTTFGPRFRLLRPKAQYAQKIQNLTFRMTTCFPQEPPTRFFAHYQYNEIANILNRHIYPWSFVLTLFSIDYPPDETVLARNDWQRDFISLKTFTLDLQLAGEYALDMPLSRLRSRSSMRRGFGSAISRAVSPSACTCRSQNDVIEVLASGATSIKAKHILVTATVKGCRSGACEVRLTRALEAILSDNRTHGGV
jgi:hypothetical protein